MKTAVFLTLIIFAAFSQIAAAAIYLIPPENNKTYKEIAEKVESNIKRKLGEKINVVNVIKEKKAITKDDLLVFIGESSTETPASPVIYSFNLDPDNEDVKTDNYWATININQPIEKLLLTAKKTVTKNYKKTIVFIISDKNVTAIEKLKELKNNENIKLIIIGENEVAAKKIEPELTHAAAIVAVYDPNIWSGNSARWIIQQAYNYKVPIVGYSKAFLKAGAMVSVYSTAQQIIEATTKQIEQWITTKTLSNTVSYPNYTIKINDNIAKALNFDRQEIIEIGKKQ